VATQVVVALERLKRCSVVGLQGLGQVRLARLVAEIFGSLFPNVSPINISHADPFFNFLNILIFSVLYLNCTVDFKNDVHFVLTVACICTVKRLAYQKRMFLFKSNISVDMHTVGRYIFLEYVNGYSIFDIF